MVQGATPPGICGVGQDIRTGDLVILVMGPPGAGKTSFVNKLHKGPKMKVGNDLKACTEVPEYVIIEPHEGPFRNHRLIIVDTPPFNSTNLPDVVVLERIAKWLENSYNGKTHITGVVYLFDLAEEPSLPVPMKDINLFKEICGLDALTVAAVGAVTKRGLPTDRATQNKKKLAENLERECNIPGTAIFPLLQDNAHSAWEIVNFLACVSIKKTSLQIQQELVEQKKPLPETRAGKLVYVSARKGSLWTLLKSVWKSFFITPIECIPS